MQAGRTEKNKENFVFFESPRTRTALFLITDYPVKYQLISGDTFVKKEDVRAIDETHGLYNHPNDYGMELIANRFFEAVEPEVKRLTGK